VTEEMLKFDKSNQIRQYATDMGEAAKQTMEAIAYGVLTNSNNYDRNSSTGDNDVGSNYLSSTALSATGLITAYTTLATMKDRKSGRYFNILPDTLICTPSLEFSARMLLMAPELHRASAYSTAEVYGTGGANPFRGIVNRIIVSPWMGTGYAWVLMKAKKPVVFQEVEPLQLLTGQIDYQNNGSYFIYDRIEYRVREWFGMGMLNSRYALLSGGTTPVVA
jgi:phage major head subunit gpT-like protein